ncbi:MAG: DUF4445 domain-containing protein [Spirochaetales bacterium]|nr:DUF4445 domain-containing protein [Spirochaetales bacterium]
MKTHTVTVHQGNKKQKIRVRHETIILDALRHAGISGIHAPCGGARTCGKCLVKVHGAVSEPGEEELRLLDEKRIKEGFRLSCAAKIAGEAEIYILDAGAVKILEDTSFAVRSLKPAVTLVPVNLPKGPDTVFRDHVSAVLSSFAGVSGSVSAGESVSVVQDMAACMDTPDQPHYFLVWQNRILGGARGPVHFGAAVDIGTTTMVLYLVDLHTGNITGTTSSLNPQRSCGADVISRIHYANTRGVEVLSTAVRNEVDCMIRNVCGSCGVDPLHIHMIVCSGNTAMLHFLAGVPVRQLGVSPFTPAFLESLTVRNDELFASVHPKGLTVLMPSIAAFVGGDITSGILSSGMYRLQEITLFVDLGTNGEVALGNREVLYTCATAAGPAFEGAHLSCGTGGIAGAVFSVRIDGKKIRYETIHDKVPVGICGSGIIDLVAVLRRKDLVDETGAFAPEGTEACGVQVKQLENELYIELSDKVRITQKDLREVQLAKAAVRAGIEALIDTSGIDRERIARVCVAGAFGNYIDVENAMAIGLFNPSWAGKIEFSGNSSGEGALEVLLDESALCKAQGIAQGAHYIELSGNHTFNEYFMEHMMFP